MACAWTEDFYKHLFNRLLLAAEMLKPMTPSMGGDERSVTEHFPHLVIVQNKVTTAIYLRSNTFFYLRLNLLIWSPAEPASWTPSTLEFLANLDFNGRCLSPLGELERQGRSLTWFMLLIWRARGRMFW